jgi:Phytanoyl-CoA dioxygenase (PhyH)
MSGLSVDVFGESEAGSAAGYELIQPLQPDSPPSVLEGPSPPAAVRSAAVRRKLVRLVSLVVDPFLLAGGLAFHAVTKRTPNVAFGSLRRLYVATDGRVNDLGGRVSTRLHPPVQLDRVHGALGDLDPGEIETITRDLDANGYHVFERKVDAAVCDSIVKFAKRAPARLVPPPAGHAGESTYDPGSPLAPRYQLDEGRIFELPELQDLATDETFMAVAQAYLKCRPINDLVAMWWSPAYGAAPSSEAAQLFHFDMDRLKFLKFFVYLTDVDEMHGPHVYVSASHVRKPTGVRRDGRIPDDEIVRQYGTDAIVEITGERGTMLAVDTRGFHKGKAPEIGDRLLLQVEYANSLFGAPYSRVVVDEGWSPEALARIQRYPAVFERFEMSSAPVAA